MSWLTDIETALTKRADGEKRLLMIFKGDGDWCPWCNKLDGVLSESPALDDYLRSEDIVGAKIAIPRKGEDTEDVRGRFGITGIPFVVFYAADGRVEGTTEFIDDGTAQSYVEWIESVDSSSF